MRVSGTITINASQLSGESCKIQMTEYSVIRQTRWNEERRYNWTPWCVVETDHNYYLEIQTIDHPDNNYNAGTRRYPYDRVTFNHWKYIFTGELEPVTLPTLSTMRQQ